MGSSSSTQSDFEVAGRGLISSQRASAAIASFLDVSSLSRLALAGPILANLIRHQDGIWRHKAREIASIGQLNALQDEIKRRVAASSSKVEPNHRDPAPAETERDFGFEEWAAVNRKKKRLTEELCSGPFLSEVIVNSQQAPLTSKYTHGTSPLYRQAVATLSKRHSYKQTCSELPRPTHQQIIDFADFIMGAHSWYKHLGDIDGDTFQAYLSPVAGMRRISTGYVDFRDDDGTRFHYTWRNTLRYRESFGHWTYGRDCLSPENTITTSHIDGEPLIVPAAVLRGNDVELTSFCHAMRFTYAHPLDEIYRMFEDFACAKLNGRSDYDVECAGGGFGAGCEESGDEEAQRGNDDVLAHFESSMNEFKQGRIGPFRKLYERIQASMPLLAHGTSPDYPKSRREEQLRAVATAHTSEAISEALHQPEGICEEFCRRHDGYPAGCTSFRRRGGSASAVKLPLPDYMATHLAALFAANVEVIRRKFIIGDVELDRDCQPSKRLLLAKELLPELSTAGVNTVNQCWRATDRPMNIPRRRSRPHQSETEIDSFLFPATFVVLLERGRQRTALIEAMKRHVELIFGDVN